MLNDAELPMIDNNNNLIKRKSLIHAFSKFINYRIVAVCAPAGYGKTIAVSQWIDKDTRAKSIFSLDEYDNNMAGFCERFCTNLHICQPQNKTLYEIITHPLFQSAPNEFTLRAVAALSSRKQAVLVLDDLHMIHNNTVLQLLLTLIKRLPKNFQIILISRQELPPTFSDLWLKGQIGRIDMEQLLFSDDEVKALNEKRGCQITQDKAKTINQQTDGWAIAINAFLLSGTESFDKANDSVEDFFKRNLWDSWDMATREFMIHTAFLRELTPSICERMTGVFNSERFLKKLVQKGAFVTQIQKGVYRYHYLLQQFLKSMAEERGESFSIALFNMEGHWHLSQLDFYSAADCFIRSKNHDGIAKCFDLLGRSDSNNYSAEKLFPILGNPEIVNTAKKYPQLLYTMAFCAFVEGRSEDMVAYMDEYYARYPEIVAINPSLANNIFYMHACDFRISLSQMMNKAEELPGVKGLQGITPKHMPILHMPMLHRSLVDFSEAAIGDTKENVRVMRQRIGWLFGYEADLMFDTMLAGLLYEQGHLEQAHEYALKANARIKSHFPLDIKLCAMSVLVCTLDATYETDEAERVISSMAYMIEEVRAYHLNNNFYALIARRKFVTGNIQAATEWLYVDSISPTLLVNGYTDLVTCSAYIITKQYDFAIVLLTKLLEISSVFNRVADNIEGKILIAIAFWKKKGRFQKKALEHLNDAVLLAHPYDFVQMFVNNGASIYGMLYKLQKSVEQSNEENKEHINFIRKLYLTIQSSPNVEFMYETEDISIKFTDRQTTILHLLYQGKTHKEIAGVLGIKPPSVSTHIKLIYNKLDVTNISDAIKRINAMGILDKVDH